MCQHSSLEETGHNSTATTTAVHMADAIGYLMRVADRAGLVTVRAHLAGIRKALLVIAAGDADGDSPESRS